MNRGTATCAVAMCPSPKDCSYHNFPRDINRQKLWIKLCKRKDPINPKTARICSLHFKPEDFERDLRNELLNLPLRKILRLGSIPSLFLLPDHGKLCQDSSPKKRMRDSRCERAEKRIKKELVSSKIIMCNCIQYGNYSTLPRFLRTRTGMIENRRSLGRKILPSPCLELPLVDKF